MNQALPLALSLALISAPPPPPPEPPVTEAPGEQTIGLPPTVCSADMARWSPIPGGGDDFEPFDPPLNTSTVIWSCRVGGRLLVVKARLEQRGPGECSATTVGAVSAWVDGVKLVNREEIGDSAQCFGAGRSETKVLFASISLTADGALTLCRDPIAEEGQGRMRCETPVATGERDKAYLPPDFGTPPGVILVRDGSPLCASLTARLAADDAAGDPSFRKEAVATTEGWANNGLYFEDVGRSVTFDIDNDGRPDILEMRSELKMHGPVGQFYWRPQGGDPAKAFTPDLWPGLSEGSRAYIAFGYRPFSLNGRAYLYVRERPASEGRLDPEAVDGALGDEGPPVVTRALLDLHPDGSGDILCAWARRPRPEEFL